MNGHTQTVSVIVPSHNRCASLHRLLDAMAVQTYPRGLVEVIVAADGCLDGTLEMLRRYQASFILRVLELPGQGAAAARNAGAAAATGSLLIFLDDDMCPAARLVESYVAAHQAQSRRVAIGYMPLVIKQPADLFRISLRYWWEGQFLPLRRTGYRYTYRNLLSGNFSIEAELFKHVGGFDPTLPRREDYELGMRLIQAGVSFVFVSEAVGYHHDQSDLLGSLQRIYREGQGDVLIGRRHPALKPDLPLRNFVDSKGPVSRLVHALAFNYVGLGDRLASILLWALGPLETLCLRQTWQKMFMGLRHYWYLRGAAEQLKSRPALDHFFQDGPARSDLIDAELTLDLADGLQAAEAALDRERPAGVRLYYRHEFVGRIPAQAGFEPLRGVHLRPALASTLSWPLLKALAVARTLGHSPLERRRSPSSCTVKVD